MKLAMMQSVVDDDDDCGAGCGGGDVISLLLPGSSCI